MSILTILNILKKIWDYKAYIPYVIIGVIVLWLYYENVKYSKQIETLTTNNNTLKENNKLMSEAYEETIKIIEEKTRIEATNKEAKNNAEKAVVRLNNLKERYKNETSNNDKFVDFSF